MADKVTRIRVETHEVLMMRPGGALIQRWCEQCGNRAGMLRVEEVALAGIGIETICQKVSLKQLHLVETSGGAVFMCLNSLLKEN